MPFVLKSWAEHGLILIVTLRPSDFTRETLPIHIDSQLHLIMPIMDDRTRLTAMVKAAG